MSNPSTVASLAVHTQQCRKRSGHIPAHRGVWHHCFMNKLWIAFIKTWLQSRIIYHATGILPQGQRSFHISDNERNKNLKRHFQNEVHICPFFFFYLAAVGRSSQPCTLRGCEACPPWCPPVPWCPRRRSGRSEPGSGWPVLAPRGWL